MMTYNNDKIRSSVGERKMEGVEFTMTFLRVIKWISFVVFILAIALTGVAHGFLFNEMGLFCKDQETKYALEDVKASVFEQKDIISSLFNKEDKPAEDNEDAIPTPVVDSTASEAAPIDTEVEASQASEYSAEDVNEIIISVMQYGSYQIEMNWLTKLLKVESFKINLSILIGYVALFVAFILHIITKHNKTFYGYILMFFGFILYAGIISLGYYVGANYIGFLADEGTLAAYDMHLVRALVIIATFVLAAFIGVPYYRLGVRQIANKTYKKRIENYKRKLQRRA